MKLQVSVSKRQPEAKLDVQLQGSPDAIRRVLGFLAMIEYNGAVGHSGTFGLDWDGDGADRINIKADGYKEVQKELRDGFEECGSYGAAMEYMGQYGSFYIKSDGPPQLVFNLREGVIKKDRK